MDDEVRLKKFSAMPNALSADPLPTTTFTHILRKERKLLALFSSVPLPFGMYRVTMSHSTATLFSLKQKLSQYFLICFKNHLNRANPFG